MNRIAPVLYTVRRAALSATARSLRLSFFFMLLVSSSPWAADWPVFGHDAQRTGWASEETALTPQNVGGLELKWSVQLKNEPKFLHSLTAPIVATAVATPQGTKTMVYVAGSSNGVFALDADNGMLAWNRTLDSRVLPGFGAYQGTFLCPNGITATPALDRGTHTLSVIAMDGRLFSLDLATGKDRLPPLPFVAPFAKSWSLNIVDGVIYTAVSQGCGDAASGFYSLDISNPRRPLLRRLLLSPTDTAGIWGSSGPVVGKNHRIYGQTADGKSDPVAGEYSNSVVAGSLPELELADYFTPQDWQRLSKEDLDLGSASPVWFTYEDHNLLAGGAKQGVVYLMNADLLGGPEHGTPLFVTPPLGNDERSCCNGKGIWGALSTWKDEEGHRWIYVPVGGALSKSAPNFPIHNGPSPHGSILAFRVSSEAASGKPILLPAWASGDFNLPGSVVIANGVVFALSTGENPDQSTDRTQNTRPAVLVALDAKTGRVLYRSDAAMHSWVHFSGMAVADGRVYAVDHDSWVYCFGLGGSAIRSIPASRTQRLASPRENLR
ncbi:MAG TPA: PQQ-binding-like beta-propeller repeat protein [Terriglobia bacterium]|nr:PQQ-binding-like beta-propeller repeat protein [Terriglobia bacterium]